ncbi:hypothetical protein BGZ54_005675 [Gamsiella multidivaricata]|nr:hypothetical protein BGZ54_005675 [Gamsiella multidivaricata]
MDLSIFDIPLLKDEVTQYLSKQDLARSVQVCRAWSAWFTPTLWRTVNFNNRASIAGQGLSALTRYQDHVQSIVAFQYYLGSASMALRPFRNLQSLEHRTLQANVHEDTIVLLVIGGTPSLQRLKLTLSLVREEIQTQLIDALHSLPRLRSLALTCYQITPVGVIQRIIDSCSHIETLHLDLGSSVVKEPYSQGDDRKQCLLAKRVMEQMLDTRIRRLSIRVSLASQESAILIPLLERCPLLERLEVDWLHHPDTLGQIIDVLRRRKCPLLKHALLGAVLRFDAAEGQFAELISALGSGERVDETIRNNGCDHGYRGYGLHTFTVESILPFEQQSALALTRHHSQTMTVLDLMSLRELRIQLFVGMMEGLPRLQRLMAAVWLGHKQDGGPGMDTVFKTQWSCLGLTELRLGLQLSEEVRLEPDHRPGNLSVADQYIGYMFSQIGRLTQLKECNLTSGVNLLDLEKGYLTHLIKLKQLRGLNLRRCTSCKLSVDVAQWMLDHWPRLIYLVVFAFEWPLDAGKAVLQEKRPWMQVEGLH